MRTAQDDRTHLWVVDDGQGVRTIGSAVQTANCLAAGVNVVTNDEVLSVRVKSIVYQGSYINQYEVVDPEGRELPSFQAGDHIDLFFRDGRIRQYSLCNHPGETHRYVFTVLREEQGRGGSEAIFDLVHVGRTLRISRPRSNFSLSGEAKCHLLLAGGIGITPIMSMIHQLVSTGADFELHYCTRSPSTTAFFDELKALKLDGRIHIHHDNGIASQGLDIAALLEDHKPGTHLYYCGPSGFMTAAANASKHWPNGTVHFELFKPPEEPQRVPNAMLDDDSTGVISVGFKVRLAESGKEFVVPSDKTIIEVLRENSIEVQTSCEAGLCRTCKTRYLEGTPDHRDYVLDDEEKREALLICCSRSKSPVLVLDM